MASEDSIYNVVIGTAGHIDHGKSSLVRRLTGINPDRLPEEKERGMTIDLGFAPFILKNGKKVGIIDVPGHERFIKNMVAGATGIDLVMLVIAADDGIMLQTREHLNIMTLLGLKRGLVVVTKIDLVERDMLELVMEDIREMVKGTFLEKAPVLPISVVTGEGVDTLLDTLNRLVLETPPKDTQGIFRMSIQRVFSAKGFGTIVTGVPASGQAQVGDTLEILPLGKIGRIRGFQAYKSEVHEVRAGHSSAINVADIDHTQVKRGDVAATPGYFKATQYLEGRFKYLPDFKKQLRHLIPIRLHTGTCEVVGRLALLDKKSVAPGEEAFVQFRLEEPIVAAEGDPFIVRLQSPMITLGGGRIISTSAVKLRRFKEEIQAHLAEHERALGNEKDLVEIAAKEMGVHAFDVKQLALKAHQPIETAEKYIPPISQEGKLLRTPSGRFIHQTGLQKAQEKIMMLLEGFHRKNPLRLGMNRIPWRDASQLDEEIFDMALRALLTTKKLSEENRLYRLANFSIQLSSDEQAYLKKIESILREARFQTPRREELYSQFKISKEKIDRLLLLLQDQGKIVLLKEDILLHHDAIEEARERLTQEIHQRGSIEAAEFRDLIGTTRKYIIPLLEYFDETGLTKREGNKRVLRHGS